MNTPSITVAICTWNRAELLRGCLQTMQKLEVEEGIDWKILVVDNNSTDATASVVEEFIDYLPVRTVVESKQGLSHARNRAIEECDTDYLLWTDDDVRVPPAWVQNYVDAIRQYDWPAVLGGSITPDFGSAPPRWLAEDWRTVANAFAVRESPGHGTPIRIGHLPFGANYATRLNIQQRHPYDPKLGRKGLSMLSGEEERVIASVLAEPEERGVWLGDVGVRHKIEPFRQKLSYLRRYFAGHGEVDYRSGIESQSDAVSGNEPQVPLWIFRALARQYRNYLVARYLKRDKAWLRKYAQFAFTLGELRARRSG